MTILGLLLIPVAIGFCCWLLFTLAVFALPALAGALVGMWVHGSGGGIVGALIVGLLTAAAVLAIGHILLVFARPMWVKIPVAAAFVAPAAIAGFHATRGIVEHVMPSEAWQMAVSVLGAVAISVTALIRVAGLTGAGSSGRTMAGT